MRRLLGELGAAPEMAVDTEADSFFHYHEQVCLIQITVNDRDYLVDPLQGFDLGGLGRILADPAKTKVFHDGEYDVLILKRQYGFSFANLFDTRIAAAALGSSSPGLAAVVSDRFGIELDKSLQRSNWSRRPLTESQIAYARLDTRFLIPLKRDLEAELERRGRRMIVEGECRRLEALEAPPRSFNPDEFVRIKGARALNPGQLQTLRELYVMRDRLARERDVPPFKVLANPIMVEVARARATTLRGLERVKGLSPKVIKRLGDELVDAAERANRRGPLRQRPRLPSKDGTGVLDDEGLELHERLKAWRKVQAQADGIDSSLIVNRHALIRLAAERPTSPPELEHVDGLLDWQVAAFGDALLRVVAEFEQDVSEGRFLPRGRRRGRRRAADDDDEPERNGRD